MTHIAIKNVGPIKEVNLKLNKINVFMGPQSSGKSTIAKIISFCSWYEKNTILGTRPNINFYKELLEFHNLEDGYFSKESYIEYDSSNCRIVFCGTNTDTVFVDNKVGPDNIFRNEKIEYIPAERNIVSIPGIGQYTESKNNILNFLYDWFRAKRSKKEDNKYQLPLSSLNNVSYYYVQDEDLDRLVLEDGKEIRLQHASSGLMSVTPLIMVFNYVINEIFLENRTQSPFEIINIENKLDQLDLEFQPEIKKIIQQNSEIKQKISNTKERVAKILSRRDAIPEEMMGEIDKMSKGLSTIEGLTNVSQNELIKTIGYDANYCLSKIIIEEPELNLFPKAQQELVYYMLEELVREKKDHQLVITTHSPYILFALNNCMMGGLINKNITTKERKSFSSYKSWINPQRVSIYEIHDGKLINIQDEDGIIEDNYLNQAYKDNSSEYMSLLNYYDGDEE